MKRSFTSLMVVAFLMFVGMNSASAQDGAPYGVAGCGLGSIVFANQVGLIQVFASTTNGSTGTQTLGITFGTSNCVQNGVIRKDSEQEAFFEMNYENIKQDMAVGQGEHLEAVASLLGCSADAQGQFSAFSQQNYQVVFPSDTTTPQQALYSYKMAISMDDTLAGACNRI